MALPKGLGYLLFVSSPLRFLTALFPTSKKKKFEKMNVSLHTHLQKKEALIRLRTDASHHNETKRHLSNNGKT